MPRAWCEALRQLQDRVPPVPFSEITATLRSAYRINTVAQVFKWIDSVPLASATIAQVHRCEMRNGMAAVIKSQYADQEHLCNMDLLNLKRLASFLQKFDMSFFDMQSVAEEFEKQIPAEFDFIREAEMMTTIRYNLQRARITDIVIPRIFPGLTSRRAITMSFIEGCRADNQSTLKLWGINPKRIIRSLGRAYGQMLLVDGVAHCDRKCYAYIHSSQICLVPQLNFCALGSVSLLFPIFHWLTFSTLCWSALTPHSLPLTRFNWYLLREY